MKLVARQLTGDRLLQRRVAVLWIGAESLRWRVPAEICLRRPETETTDSYGLRFTSAHPIDRARIALALFNHNMMTTFETEPLAAD